MLFGLVKYKLKIETKSYIFELFFLVLTFFLVLGLVLVYAKSRFAIAYWAILILSAIFIPKAWILRFGAFISQNWCSVFQKKSIKEFKRIVFATMVFAIICNGFLFANEFFSHDSITFLKYSTGDFQYYTGIGRFGIPLYELIKGPLVSTWIVGLLFLLWMTLSSFFTVCTLEINTLSGVILVSGLMCTNLALTLTGATYVYCMDEYAFALMLSTVAAYLFCRCRFGTVPGIVCLCGALAIYQAYFTVTLALCFLVVIQDLLENKDIKIVITCGLKYVILLLCSFFIYFALWTGCTIILGVEKLRLNESLLSSGINSIPALLAQGISGYGRFLLVESEFLGCLRPLFNIILLVLVGIKLLNYFLNFNNCLENKILLVVLFCLAPLVFNSASILLMGSASELTQFACEMIYVFFAFSQELSGDILIDYKRYRIVTSVLLCCVLWQNIVFANQIYIKKELEKSATLSLTTRVIDRIELTEGYVSGQTPVVFIGELWKNPYLNRGRSGTEAFAQKTGVWSDYSATYNLQNYITEYLNYPLMIEDAAQFAALEEVQDMPAFPNKDSIRIINDTVVVKLS